MEDLAKAVGGRLVKIKAEYEITEEDGSELQEPDESNEGSTTMPLMASSKKC